MKSKYEEQKIMARTVKQSATEYARGIAGGFLFSLPLLYTMEVWWRGFIAPPLHLIGFVAGTFVLLLGYNRYSGMRRDATFTEVAIDSVEELGIGLVVSTIILLALNRISSGMHLDEILGKVVIEAMSVAIGVSVGTAQLKDKRSEKDDVGMAGDSKSGAQSPERADAVKSVPVKQMAVGCCGAVLLGSNIAPTEEVVRIASDATAFHLVALSLMSMALMGVIYYYSNFRGASRIAAPQNFAGKLAALMLMYCITLLVSGALLFLYGQFDGLSMAACLSEVVVLGFPASIGTAAGSVLL